MAGFGCPPRLVQIVVRVNELFVERGRNWQAMVSDIQSQSEALGRNAADAVVLAANKSYDPARYASKLEELSRDVEELCNEAKGRVKEIDELAEQMIKKAAFKGQADYFETAADRHAKAAGRWLFTTVALSIATLGIVVVAFGNQIVSAPVPTTVEVKDALPWIAGRVIVISFFSSLVVWASRVYRAHRHNQTVNEHRLNALRTVVVLSTESSTAGLREAALGHAMPAIFGHQPSGYGDQEVASPIGPLVDAARVMGK